MKVPKTTADKGAAESATSKKRLQMSDIARLAGVSTSTVSRALNRRSVVNAETTARILDLAKSVGYTINAGAANLRTGTNRTVAVVIPLDPATRQHISDPFFLSILGRLADTLTERGYDMLFTRVDAQHLESVGAVHAMGKAMGVIVIGQWHSHDQLNALSVQGVPFVVWGAQVRSQLYCTVGTDNVQGGYIATKHLIARGRQRLAFLGDPDSPEIGQRYEGFLRALSEHKESLSPPRLLNCPFIPEQAELMVKNMVDEGAVVDGIVAASDLLAMTAINTLQARGYDVPKRVSVVGYDDIALARFFTPALTTVSQPLEEGAKALVDSLISLVAGERPLPKLLHTELKVRVSG